MKNPGSDAYLSFLYHFWRENRRGLHAPLNGLVLPKQTKKLTHWVKLLVQPLSRNHVFVIFRGEPPALNNLIIRLISIDLFVMPFFTSFNDFKYASIDTKIPCFSAFFWELWTMFSGNCYSSYNITIFNWSEIWAWNLGLKFIEKSSNDFHRLEILFF